MARFMREGECPDFSFLEFDGFVFCPFYCGLINLFGRFVLDRFNVRA